MRFRVPTMDCAVEDSEIRRAVAGITGIRAMNFQLAQRTLALDAPAGTVTLALAAIRKAGFDPQPIADGHRDEHDHGLDPGGLWRLGLALVLAHRRRTAGLLRARHLGLEGRRHGTGGRGHLAGGLSTLQEGPCRTAARRLNINALMTVAVTGAFLIGQWPEAAMVMALYAIAELIEARAVDRARNAIKGLLDLTPRRRKCARPTAPGRTVPVAEVALDAMRARQARARAFRSTAW